MRADTRDYISNQLKKQHSERMADSQEILEFLTAVMRGEVKENILRMDGKGYQVMDHIESSVRDRLKAAELLGKAYQLWQTPLNVNLVLPYFEGESEINE